MSGVVSVYNIRHVGLAVCRGNLTGQASAWDPQLCNNTADTSGEDRDVWSDMAADVPFTNMD